jgi:hypothetical protein
MSIVPNRGEGRLPFVRLSADAPQCCTNLPWQNYGGDARTDEPEARHDRRRLIYGSINFVIGSLGKVRLGHGRNTYHGAKQEQNEHPNPSPHR